MENQNTWIWEVSISEFLLVTVVLAGGAAFMTGRAIAGVWQGRQQLYTYMVLLAAATRFIHFALFDGTLLAPYYYVVDLVVLVIIAEIGFRLTRAKQMQQQYGFLGRGTTG